MNRRAFSLAFALVAGLAPGAARGQSFTVLHQFEGQALDGAAPAAGLTLVGRTLYGTTYLGGAGLSGTIFAIDLGGHYKTAYTFGGHPDGAGPRSDLTLVGNTLYGTTQYGGSSDRGTVFSYTPGSGYQVLYSFTGGADGARPAGGLLYVNGLLYGTTEMGGTEPGGVSGCTNEGGCGTLFSLDPAKMGSEKILYAFQGGADGSMPSGNLALVGNVIYGTTVNGGNALCYALLGCGTIYKYALSSGGSPLYQQVYVFQNGPSDPTDGAAPAAGLTIANGLLYGDTFRGGSITNCLQIGCGTVFSFDPKASQPSDTLVTNTFNGQNGVLPNNQLSIYGAGVGSAHPRGFAVGVADLGGQPIGSDPQSFGTIYQVDLGNKLHGMTVLHAFEGETDGAYPVGSLVRIGRRFYGVTHEGGSYDSGTVWVLQAPKP